MTFKGRVEKQVERPASRVEGLNTSWGGEDGCADGLTVFKWAEGFSGRAKCDQFRVFFPICRKLLC